MNTENQPKSANEVLARVRDDHNYMHDPADLNSTGGIQRNIKALWHGLEALANHIDGVATGETDTEGRPVKLDRSEGDRSSGELLPAERPYPAESARVA